MVNFVKNEQVLAKIIGDELGNRDGRSGDEFSKDNRG